METTTTQSETSAGADNANSTASPEPSTHAADFAAPEKCTQNGCSNVGIHHVGIHVKDPLLSAQFYRDILGMQLVGGSPADTPAWGPVPFLLHVRERRATKSPSFPNPSSVTLPLR